MTEVEKKIEEEIKNNCNPRNVHDTFVFTEGTHFGIQLGKDIRLEEVLECLRSEAMKTVLSNAKQYYILVQVADFLESKFKGKP